MKYTKKQANYRIARIGCKKLCSKCKYYGNYSCSKVNGKIMPKATCKYWRG